MAKQTLTPDEALEELGKLFPEWEDPEGKYKDFKILKKHIVIKDWAGDFAIIFSTRRLIRPKAKYEIPLFGENMANFFIIKEGKLRGWGVYADPSHRMIMLYHSRGTLNEGLFQKKIYKEIGELKKSFVKY